MMISKIQFQDKPYLLTSFLIICTFFLRIIIASKTGLGVGEAYYFGGTKHPALSYFDQPPLFFWLGSLSTRLFGINNLALRLPSILLFSGSTWLMYLIGKRLFSAWAGFYSALLVNISVVFAVPVSVWFQPDAPLIFFWLLSVYFIIKILFPANHEHTTPEKELLLWILTGISLGLTTLSKYHAIFLLIGVFLFIIFNKEQRHWLKHPGPYLALILCFIMSFPILIWNYENNWVSFIFQGSRAKDETHKIHLLWMLRSVAGQALWLAPWIWIPLMKQLFVSYKLGKSDLHQSLCFWVGVLPIAFFTIITLWTDIAYHFHWQAPGYLMFFLPLGDYTFRKLKESAKSKRRIKRWIIFSGSATVILGALFLIQTNTGFWKIVYLGKVPDKLALKYDPTLEGFDYYDITTRFEKEGWLNDTGIFVGTLRWWEAGKIDWALKGNKKLVIFHDDPRNQAFFVNPQSLVGQNAIIVTETNKNELQRNVLPFFDHVKQLPDIVIIRGGVPSLNLNVYFCSNFHVPQKAITELPVFRQMIGEKPF